MRTAMDEILDQNLDEKQCSKLARQIMQAFRDKGLVRGDLTRREWLQLFYSMQLVREDIADSLGIPSN